jgi:hypothetical protein
MRNSLQSAGIKLVHSSVRAALQLAPRDTRFGRMRAMVDCDPAPDSRLTLKIAETQAELEACYHILHDAYVESGFMQPDPSGMRVTKYHALPTTTTLCAKIDDRVVGTLSIVRDGVFGFPMQACFDLSEVRAKGGQIAEISALAIDRDFRSSGRRILFPLMKFMFEYCTQHFDTRHLVIAVNPSHIEMYEALLMFQRLQSSTVDRYDFVNGAPAIGATLDLAAAPAQYQQIYGHCLPRKNLFRYFTELEMPNIQLPDRTYYTTNHPVLTPEMMDHFFNRRTKVFDSLDDRQRALLRSIYSHDAYAQALPLLSPQAAAVTQLRRQERYSIRCPAQLRVGAGMQAQGFDLNVVRLSDQTFEAESPQPLPQGELARVTVQLGEAARSVVLATGEWLRESMAGYHYGFRIVQRDAAWRRCADALQQCHTHADLALAA